MSNKDQESDFASRITAGFNNATAAKKPASDEEKKKQYMDAMKRRQMAMRE